MKNKKRVLQIVNDALKESFVNGKLSEPRVNKIVDAFKKLPTGEAIVYLTEYAKALKREEEKSVLHIQSSISLSSTHKTEILSHFKKDFKISKVEVKLNPSLKAGLMIKIGDMVYEDTLGSRINQLKDAITNG